MAVLMYHIFTSTALFTLGIYHLISSVRSHLRSPRDFLAKPYHPLPHPHRRLRHLPLYLLLLSLLSSASFNLLSSSLPDPLLRHHRLSSLHSSAVLLLFLLLSLSLPFLPSDLSFLLASASFALLSSSSISPSDSLQSKCDSISASISLASAAASLVLAFQPRLFVADVALAASVCLQGLWSLQTGLSLYVEGFIPEGCHRLLDVPGGIAGSTRCELDESRLRAAALLDLVFVLHAAFVAVVVVVIYVCLAKMGGGLRRNGVGGSSYELLPTVLAAGSDSDHVQMKALAQA